ncbi:GlxA family transcriptional regulator [Pseudomonas sp. Gutcm_11s]|uniref:GlxA family transcriptional regulator n=1 Tax=Pseudomonas sp. Gutcm_11s TaxID=3026088 RepID=UPI002360B338|nr:helix-turn-helix domain-containing protein [Pseudomonas sp. Gutcm_11s]MDD0841447.1 helix-turn-helix domain-containing protein [Pseudomonas sp. Gutcm_11s]
MTTLLRIGLLLFPGCMPAGLLAFADMLHATNRRTGRSLFETDFVAEQDGAVTCAHGLVLMANHRFTELALDAILIPGFWAESAQHVGATLHDSASLLAGLAKLSKRCRIWSYCTGVCLAAASGRLNGEHATATWWLADMLVQHYPKVRWQYEQNCIFNERTGTASGVNGYLPLAQALIERQVDATVFNDLNRLMVLPRPIQSHDAFQALSLIEQSSQLLRRLHTLVQGLPAERITVGSLAGELGMTERTLARKVREETGSAIATYARRIKLSQVSERLILTSVPLKTISSELGFSSDSNLRRMFKELTGLTPAQYRQRFARF